MIYTGKIHPELIAKKGEEISLSSKVRGIIVLAEPKDKGPLDRKHWILLISHINDEDKSPVIGERKGIYRHLSYNIENGDYFLSKGKDTSLWGKIDNYNFYLATEEQKQLIKDTLRKHHLKYVKALNTLIDR